MKHETSVENHSQRGAVARSATACRCLMILVVTKLRSVIQNPSRVSALVGCLTISGSALAAGLAPSAAYAAPGVTSVCPINDQQKLIAELTGNNRSFVAPGNTVSYVEQLYNPGPETYQIVITSTLLDAHLTPRQYPSGTTVSLVNGRYLLNRQSDVPMHPGETRTVTLSAVVGQKASSAGAQLQAWGVSETLKGAACDVGQPVIVIIHRVPKGAPHTGDGSMATKVVGRPPGSARVHKAVARGNDRKPVVRGNDSKAVARANDSRAVARQRTASVPAVEHLTFRFPRGEIGRPVTIAVTVALSPSVAAPVQRHRTGHRAHRAAR
jgi:hypothetical protein